MHLTWKELRVALTKEITQPEAERAFRLIRSKYPVFDPYIDTGSAVKWLLDYRSHEVEAEDAMLTLLRSLALDSSSGPWQSLMFLGIWPSMEWVFRKLLPFSKGDHSIISAIWGGLIDVMDKDEFWCRPDIAKHLMYAVWKRARKNLLSPKKEREQTARLAKAEYAALPKISGDPIIRETQDAWPSHFKSHGDKPPEIPEEIKDLRQLLVDDLLLSEADSDLLIRHFVSEEPLSDIAEQLGITPAACRQRCSRMVRRLRFIPSRLRWLLVTHLNVDGMEIRKRDNDANNNEEGGSKCPKVWMN